MTLYPRKKARPFGLPSTPFDPRTGTYLPLSEPGDFAEVTVREVGHDVLLCDDREGRPALILKPWSLRASTFDGQTLDGVDYASTDLDVRTATVGSNSVEERVVGAYFAGEKIMAYRRAFRDAVLGVVAGELTDIESGSHRLFWEDMNTAGRRWINPSGVLIARITGFSAGVYTWDLAYGLGPASGQAVELHGTTIVPVDGSAKVVLHQANGAYRFFYPLEAC